MIATRRVLEWSFVTKTAAGGDVVTAMGLVAHMIDGYTAQNDDDVTAIGSITSKGAGARLDDYQSAP
jgi:hypothetical protein